MLLQILVLVTAMLVTACSEFDDAPTSDYQKASQAIDSGRYEFAMVLMEKKLEERTSDHEARTLLAAAYAGRAGLRFAEYADLTDELARADRTAEGYFETSGSQLIQRNRHRAGTAKERSLLDVFDSFYRTLYRVDLVVRTFKVANELSSPEAVKDVKKALEILEESQRLPPGSRIYRAILRMAIVRHDLVRTYDFSYMARCYPDAAKMTEHLAALRVELGLALEDMVDGTVQRERKLRVQEMAHSLDARFEDSAAKVQAMGAMSRGDVTNFVRKMNSQCRG